MIAINESSFNTIQREHMRELRSTCKLCKIASITGDANFNYLFSEVDRLVNKTTALGIKLK